MRAVLSRPAVGRRPRAWLALGVVPMALVAQAVVVPAGAEVGTPTTYQGHQYATGAGAASADKPQSKLWHSGGSWYALMTGTSSVNIYKLVDHKWVDTKTVVDTRITSTGDALWDETAQKLYVVSRTASGTGSIRVFRFSFSAANGTFTPDSGFPVRISGGGSESATIAKDTCGRLWVTFTRSSRVYVTHSRSSETSWATPFRISGADTSVSSDDISAVTALDNGRIGVMWSDQASEAFRFSVHQDKNSAGTCNSTTGSWTHETPVSGTRIADDHLNIKSVAQDAGRVHVAVKTSLDNAGGSSSSPSIVVLTRSAAGAWSQSTVATVRDNMTRPQLALDTTNKLVHVLQTEEGGGSAYIKSSPMGDTLSFAGGSGTPLVQASGASINNVSTTKQEVNAATGLVAIATDSTAARYYHAEMSLGTTTAPPPTDPTPPPPTDPTPPPPTDPTPPPPTDPTPPPPAEPETVTVTTSADTYVQSSTGNTNYGGAAILNVDNSPVAHAYAKFDLTPYQGRTIQSAKLTVPVTTSGSVGAQAVKLAANGSWSETGLTWNNRPALGATLGTLSGPTAKSTTYEVTLSAGELQGSLGSVMSLGMDTSSTDGLDIESKEANPQGAMKLTLVLAPAG